MQSMTGFGSAEMRYAQWGKVSVEMRSSNHKFLETVLHLPEGLLSLEEKIKKEIESKIKRGRVVCAVSLAEKRATTVFINRKLLRSYVSALKSVRQELDIKENLSLDTLVHMPGVFSLLDEAMEERNIWPHLKQLVIRALKELELSRGKEGNALAKLLGKRVSRLQAIAASLETKYDRAVQSRLREFKTEEERLAFQKSADISEELERLLFHASNFNSKLKRAGCIGKELDFIAQEMQREANTSAAKSCNAAISAKIVWVKSQIEKIREQVQNIE